MGHSVGCLACVRSHFDFTSFEIVSLGFIVLAMLILIAQLPQFFPLSEDGGDHGGDPGVAILLVGGFGAQILLVMVPPGIREPTL